MNEKKDDIPQKIVFNSDLYWDIPLYVKNDPLQEEYRLVSIKLMPGVTDKKGNQIPAVKFKLESMHRKFWLYDFQVSTERDNLKQILSKDEDDD